MKEQHMEMEDVLDLIDSTVEASRLCGPFGLYNIAPNRQPNA